MKITIIGTGHVGLVTGLALAHIGHDITCFDINSKKIDLLKNGKMPFTEQDAEKYLSLNKSRLTFTTDLNIAYQNPDIIVITVQTPEKENGDVELKYLYEACDKMVPYIKRKIPIVIKSTVPIGTNEKVEEYINSKLNNKIKICTVSNPEFLSQGSAIHDTLFASRIIVGSEDEFSLNEIKKMYEPLLKEPYNVPYLEMSRKNAEMVKYVSNSFLALKISFINEIANLSTLLGTNIDEIVKGISLDTRIGDKFLKPGLGYGGSCFQKDTKALLYQSNNNLKTIESAIKINNNQKLIFANKILEKYKDLKNINIAILGVTFKPNIDDITNSPAISNIDFFLDNNANIFVYDILGLKNLKSIYKDKINYCNSIEECIKDKDIAIIFTELESIVNFDIENYSKLMKTPIVYDGRNCYKITDVANYDIDYYSIGRAEIKNGYKIHNCKYN